VTREQYTAEWWPTAHAAWQRITREDIPVLWVPLASWYQEDWVDYDIEAGPPFGALERRAAQRRLVGPRGRSRSGERGMGATSHARART
jgi:hypothetical protein